MTFASNSGQNFALTQSNFTAPQPNFTKSTKFCYKLEEIAALGYTKMSSKSKFEPNSASKRV